MSVIFAYPYSGATYTATLPNPTLGDSLTVETGVNLKLTMDGTVYTTLNGLNGIILLNFRNVPISDVEDLVALLEATSGIDNIKYTDKDSVDYEVIILSNPLEYATVGENECEELCDFTLQLIKIA